MMRRPVGLLPTVVERAAAREVDRRERSIGGVFSVDGSPIGTTQARIAGSVMRVAHGIVAGEVQAGLPFALREYCMHASAMTTIWAMAMESNASDSRVRGSDLEAAAISQARSTNTARSELCRCAVIGPCVHAHIFASPRASAGDGTVAQPCPSAKQACSSASCADSIGTD